MAVAVVRAVLDVATTLYPVGSPTGFLALGTSHPVLGLTNQGVNQRSLISEEAKEGWRDLGTKKIRVTKRVE